MSIELERCPEVGGRVVTKESSFLMTQCGGSETDYFPVTKGRNLVGFQHLHVALEDLDVPMRPLCFNL